MLVLTRKRNETIVITTHAGERVVVMVCAVRGRQCRIGVDAPHDTSIVRGETEGRENR